MSNFKWTSTTPINVTNLNKMIDMIYPVGSIYLSVNDVNPSTIFGGTWERIKDRFLLGAGDTYSNGSTGGEATHKLTAEEMPRHRHSFDADTGNKFEDATLVSLTAEGSAYPKRPSFAVGGGYTADGSVSITNAGGSEAHNNMPPYLTVYMWKRTS